MAVSLTIVIQLTVSSYGLTLLCRHSYLEYDYFKPFQIAWKSLPKWPNEVIGGDPAPIEQTHFELPIRLSHVEKPLGQKCLKVYSIILTSV